MALNKYHLAFVNMFNRLDHLKYTLDYLIIEEAINKQIPMKVVNNFFDLRCPACGNIGGVKRGQLYCDNCGQALDWEV